MIDRESLVTYMFEIGAVKITDNPGDNKRGPIRVDLRLLVSRPSVLRRVARIMQSYASDLKFERIAAIPMSGLPVGLALSFTLDKPLLYTRLPGSNMTTESGRYVTGTYSPGETVLLVDDSLYFANTKLNTIKLLEMLRLKVSDLMVILDHEQGAKEKLAEKGYTVHAILTISELVDILQRLRHITPEQHQSIMKWLEEEKKRYAQAAAS